MSNHNRFELTIHAHSYENAFPAVLSNVNGIDNQNLRFHLFLKQNTFINSSGIIRYEIGGMSFAIEPFTHQEDSIESPVFQMKNCQFSLTYNFDNRQKFVHDKRLVMKRFNCNNPRQIR